MRLALILLISMALPALAQDESRIISVVGDASVAAVPDMAELTIGVTRDERRPDAAMDGVADAAAEVFALLDAAGIAPEDRRTSGLSLQPRWERNSNGSSARIAGYVASTRITVRVRDLQALGPLITDTVGDGANTLSGLNFVVADPAPLEAEARRLAILNGMEKAKLFADTAQVELGELVSILDVGAMAQPGGPMMAEMALRSDAMPIAEGEVTISASVSIRYAIAE